jgi:hypothetical protein
MKVAFSGKWVQLLKEAVPTLRRVAFMFNPYSSGVYFASAEAAAAQLGIEAIRTPASDVSETEHAMMPASLRSTRRLKQRLALAQH